MPEKKVNKIIESAIKIFAQVGYEGASVDAIVEDADVAKGTFYYYFKSKEDLLISIIKNGIDRLSQDMLKKSVSYKSPSRKIKSIITSQFHFFITNADLCRVLLSEVWKLESKWKKEYVTIRNQYIKALSRAIKVGQKSGDFNNIIDPVEASNAIFGMVATSALDYVMTAKKCPGDLIRTISTMAVRGLRQ